MKKNILESSFIDINTDDVIEFLNSDKNIKLGLFGIEQPSSPQLFFYDTKEIEAGLYSFDVNGLAFTRCWIEPHSKSSDDGSLIKYCSGSYYVRTL
jgi:hypothetical protein